MTSPDTPVFQRGITVIQALLTLLATLIAILTPVGAAIYRQALMLERHDWWISQHTSWTEKRNDYLDSIVKQQQMTLDTNADRLVRIEMKLDEVSRKIK